MHGYIKFLNSDIVEEKQQKYFAQITYELRSKLEELGLSDIFLQSRNAYAIVPGKINCDYFAAIAKNEIGGYKGEYMTQYSWAEMTLGELIMKSGKDIYY